jgi:arylsulfatase A-like enzyme/Flp pilus assembly protein TadD
MANHRLLAYLAAFMAVLACSDGGVESQSVDDQRPNLLLVTLDTARADRLGPYGYSKALTPSLDALAARGVVFEEAYSVAPMTLPAHATILTGLLPPQHGARVNGIHRLAEDSETMAETLSAAGFRTGAFVAAFVLDDRFGLDQGFDRYDDSLAGAYEQQFDNTLARYRSGDQVVDAALSWLNEVAVGGSSQPFFAWVHLYDAHFPWYGHRQEAGTYDGELTFVDSQLGRLLTWIEQHGLEEDTVVMAVADHGEGLGDHHEIEHAYLLNEEALHIPWVVAGPGSVGGHRVDALVSLEDVHPTALALLGVPGPDGPGRSLTRALSGEPQSPGVSYAETDLPWTSYRWAPQRSLTTADWKYIRTPLPELYHRATDRAELANLAHVRPAVLEDMERHLASLEQQLGNRISETSTLTSQEIEALAALGYVAGPSHAPPIDLSGLADVKSRLGAKDLSTELRRRVTGESIAPEERVAIARRLVELSPETPAFHHGLATALAETGERPAALPVHLRALELAPDDPGLHYALGDTLQQLGRTGEARPHLAMALELEPTMAAAHVGMGNVLRDENRTDLAAGSYTEALRLRPDYPEAHFNLAVTLLDRGKSELAAEHFEQSLAQKPGWPLAHRALADLMLAERRFAEAIEHLSALREGAGEDASVHNGLGVAYQHLGQPQQALEHYLAAMALAPNDFWPHLNRARMAWDYGNDDIAFSEFEAALSRAPDLFETNERFARFLTTTARVDLRDGARGIVLAEYAVNISEGGSAIALDTLSRAYASVGRLSEAQATARHARQRAVAAGDAERARDLDAFITACAEAESSPVDSAAAVDGQPSSLDEQADQSGASPETDAPPENTEGTRSRSN